ncbi:MAG: putative Ig domain-containing protein [Thermodesulfovibrio sp.]|nr:putative Ig domain-containing protein [Thermodesulfovibrio sp.]
MLTRIKNQGFTLVELAIVLIVIGLLVGVGASLIGPLTKRAKLTETRETVKQAKEAVLGFAVKNGYLPADLDVAGARKLDAWGRSLQYFKAPEISSGDICGKNTTSIQIYECTNTNCSVYLTKSNIAFIIYSAGEDGDSSCTGVSSPFYVREQGMPYNTPCTYTSTNPKYYYDDVIAYVSLDEIRSLRGCPQPLTIISPNVLPEGQEDSFYSYSLQAVGGKPPYTWSGSAGYGLTISPSGIISGKININDLPPNTGELTTCSASINITATVNDSAGSPSQTYTGTIPVNPLPLKIITETLPTGYMGFTYTVSLLGSGGKSSYTWSLYSGNLPSGLNLSTIGLISGTITDPTTGCDSTYVSNFVVKLDDGCGQPVYKAFSITVNDPDCVGTGGSGGGGGGGCNSYSLSISNQGNDKSFRIDGGSCVNLGNGGSSYITGLSGGSILVIRRNYWCWDDILLQGTMQTLDSNGNCNVNVSCQGNSCIAN